MSEETHDHKALYQDIFNWCQECGALPLQSEMDDLLDIIQRHTRAQAPAQSDKCECLSWGEPHYFIEVKDGERKATYNAEVYGVKDCGYLDFAKELIAETELGLKARTALSRPAVTAEAAKRALIWLQGCEDGGKSAGKFTEIEEQVFGTIEAALQSFAGRE